MKHLDLFAGIGGFSLAASRVWPDHKLVAFVEIDPFCQNVLKKHWPDVPVISDIRNVKGDDFEAVGLISGGFPCQPFSAAGQRRGTEDDRYLWPEMLRVISEVRPRWVVAENVAGLVSIDKGLVLKRVLIDLESEGYQVQPFIIPACAVGAPHRRDRIWIVANRIERNKPRRPDRIGRGTGQQEEVQRNVEHAAHSTQQLSHRTRNTGEGRREKHSDSGWDASDATNPGPESLRRERENSVFQNADAANAGLLRPPKHEKQTAGIEQCGEDAADTGNQRLQGSEQQGTYGKGPGPYVSTSQCDNPWNEHWHEVALRTCVRGMDDGLSRGLDRTGRLKALGNAIVPQVAEQILRAIQEADKRKGEAPK